MNKGLETVEEIKEKYKDDNGLQRRLSIIENELKALEIIISKRLNVDEIYHKDYEWYLLDHRKDDSKLIPTKEEYNLLKEILG